MQDDFDEEAFILDRLNMGITLQNLHDSLLQYFNILKNSLVELINRDYADFVNLSTNLVGLDKIIKNLEDPLVDMRQRISNAISRVLMAKRQFEFNVGERKKLREKKEVINTLLTVAISTGRLERWLSTTKSVVDFPLSPISSPSSDNRCQEEQQIDRMAQEYIKLNHFVKKCVNHPFINELKPRINVITASLQDQLEGRLRCSLDLCHEAQSNSQLHSVAFKKASSALCQVLSTFLSIDKLAIAVALYRNHCLHSQLSKIFLPCLALSASGADPVAAASVLKGMFDEAIALLDNELVLFQTFVFKRPHKSYEPLSEFDVIVDCFFPETVEILFNQLPDIFSAGNPDRFHKLYNISLNFLDHVEARADSIKQVTKLREHAAYTSFLNKWSLCVYFQLRYQECVEVISKCWSHVFKETEESSTDYALVITSTATEQLKRCWSEDVYLDSLRHRFWKLTLQIINFYAYLVGEKSVHQISSSSDKASISHIKPLFLVFLDGSLFLRWIEEGNLAGLILSKMCPRETDSPLDWLSQCVEDSSERIKAALASVKANICCIFEKAVKDLVKQVHDLPRQYRRTNREWPSTPSCFIPLIVKQLTDLSGSLQSDILTKPQVEASSTLRTHFIDLFEQMVLQTTKIYSTQTSELMTSVRKVEDSLRRLRVARAVGVGHQGGGVGRSDDDKIRHQVRLDILEYISQLKSLPLLSKNKLELHIEAFATIENLEENSVFAP